MSQRQTAIRADLDTIFNRLVVTNEQLDRRLGLWLARQGLRPEHLEQVSGIVRDPARLSRARERIAAELSRMPEPAWEAVTRPSVQMLSAALGRSRRLLRV